MRYGNPSLYFRGSVFDVYMQDDWRLSPRFSLEFRPAVGLSDPGAGALQPDGEPSISRRVSRPSPPSSRDSRRPDGQAYPAGAGQLRPQQHLAALRIRLAAQRQEIHGHPRRLRPLLQLSRSTATSPPRCRSSRRWPRPGTCTSRTAPACARRRLRQPGQQQDQHADHEHVRRRSQLQDRLRAAMELQHPAEPAVLVPDHRSLPRHQGHGSGPPVPALGHAARRRRRRLIPRATPMRPSAAIPFTTPASVQLIRRFRGGLSASGNYTFSKSIDDGGAGGAAPGAELAELPRRARPLELRPAAHAEHQLLLQHRPRQEGRGPADRLEGPPDQGLDDHQQDSGASSTPMTATVGGNQVSTGRCRRPSARMPRASRSSPLPRASSSTRRRSPCRPPACGAMREGTPSPGR